MRPSLSLRVRPRATARPRLAASVWRITPCRLVATFALSIGTAGALHAQSGGVFAITKSTVDSGAGASSAVPYGLRYTIGQPDAGYASGGVFAVRGGFWGSRSNPPTDSIFSHGFE